MASSKRWPIGSPAPFALRLLGALSVLGAGMLSACGDGIPDFTSEELTETTGTVREAYRLKDYEYGAELGEQWAVWAPEALELKAWTVANLARAQLGVLATEMAEDMLASHPDSSWSSFAIAAARVWGQDRAHEEEALGASENAMSGLPDLIDAVTLRGEALSIFQGPDSALAFVETLPEEIRMEPDVLVLKAKQMWPMTLEFPDSVIDPIQAIYDEILQEHPFHVSANLDAAILLDYFRDEPAKALSHVERAASVTPSPWVHGNLWRAIFTDASLSDEEKTARVTADVEEILEDAGESPARWVAMASDLGASGMTEIQAELEERILENYPNSEAVERVLANRFQSFSKRLWGEPSLDGEGDQQKRERLAEMLGEFIDRREHRNPNLLLEARWDLFLLQREDPNADPETLRELADGVVAQMEIEPGPNPSAYYGIGALTLAEHPRTLEDAKRLIDLGLAELEAREAEAEETESEEADPEEDGGEEAANPQFEAQRAMFSAALGLVMVQEGRLDEAEEELASVRDLDPESYYSLGVLPFAYLHSGQLMEKRAELARSGAADGDAEEYLQSAGDFFLEGIRLDYYPNPSQGIPWINPNEIALEALHAKRHGDMEGFDDFLASAKDEGWEERRDGILGDRIEDPEKIAAFSLETLDGEEVTSESLLGKVLVINFWGTW